MGNRKIYQDRWQSPMLEVNSGIGINCRFLDLSVLDGSFFNTKIRGCGAIGSISVFQTEGAGS